jgi:competence protein ComEC
MQWWMFQRTIHISWYISIVAGAFVLGVVMAQWLSAGRSIMWLGCGLVLFVLVATKRYVWMIPLAISAGLLLGLWRGSGDYASRAVYDYIRGRQVVISGVVADDVDKGKKGETVLRLSELARNNRTLPGKLWVTGYTSIDIKRGDMVVVTGNLQQGFGTFEGVIYRATVVSVQRPQPGDVARQVRDWFADTIRRVIPEPQAALGIGFLLGQRRELPPDLDQALQIAGLTHIVVASGYNLTILVRIARRLFVSVSKYLSALSATLMITSFVAMTGASPSMTRAGLVSGLSLAAWYYGRSFHPLVLLPFAAAITVAVNPSFAWNDIGWQLSFAAFAGVMILAPLVHRYFFGESKPGFLRQIATETISATIMTLPILIVSFGQVSNVAIVANILIVPLVPLAMLLTFVAGVFVVVFPAGAYVVGMLAHSLLLYMTSVAEFLSKIPWAVSEVNVSPWIAVLIYAVIISVIAYMWRATQYSFRDTNIVE